MSRLAGLAALLLFAAAGTLSAQDSADARAEEFRDKLRALNWVVGPRELTMSGNATLSLPEGYVYLDAANTTKFEELNENLSSGKEVMIAPKSLTWTAYLIFEDEGYVKDNEKIDADAILKTLKQSAEAANADRRPGDKVAEYGLTGLIVGGAVAAAVKTGLLKGLWKFIVAGIAAFWKLLLAGAAAVAAALRSLFKRRQAER